MATPLTGTKDSFVTPCTSEFTLKKNPLLKKSPPRMDPFVPEKEETVSPSLQQMKLSIQSQQLHPERLQVEHTQEYRFCSG